jgi:hypothetical protein
MAVVLMVAGYAISWLLGGWSTPDFDTEMAVNYDQLVSVIKSRHGVITSKYYARRKLVAWYCSVGCNLRLANGREYLFPIAPGRSVSSTTPQLIEEYTPVFENEDVSPISTSDFSDQKLEPERLKTSLFPFPARRASESVIPLNSEKVRLVNLNGRTYKAAYLKHNKIEVSDWRSNMPVAKIRQFLLWSHAKFDSPVPLSRGILIYNLVMLSYPSD